MAQDNPAPAAAPATVTVLPVQKSVEAFMQEDLARSGLAATEIGATLEGSEFSGIIGYRIPYYLPDGTPHPQMYRVRLATPTAGGGKYSQPSKQVFEEGTYPYLPPISSHPSLERSPAHPVLLVEGEKKTLAAIKFLRRVAYGIGGCWNWARTNEATGTHTLHTDLAERFRPGELVEIVFDGDVLTNMEVARAAGTLRLRLEAQRGVEVRFVILPTAKKGRCGLDDFLMEQHAAGVNVQAAFDALPRVSGKLFPIAHADLWDELGLDLSASGTPQNGMSNVRRVLLGHPRLKGMLRFNESEQCFELGDPDGGPTVTHNVDLELLTFLQNGKDVGMCRLTVGPVLEAMNVIRPKIAYSPIVEYLDRAEKRWDGTPRVDEFLARICGLPVTKYHRSASATFFLQATERAVSPGCKGDYMLILSGKGGVGKTKLIHALAGSHVEWTKEVVGDLSSKDGQLALTSGWIVELSEGVSHALTSSDVLKSVLTRTVDEIRPPYGRATERFPRRTVIVGTTNDTAMLKHEAGSGNRRFLILDVGSNPIDLELVAAEIEQVWGEARTRVRAGERYWNGLEQLAASTVEAHTAADPWEEVLSEYVSVQTNIRRIQTQYGPADFVASKDLRELALQIPNAQLHAGTNKRLRRAMESVEGGVWLRHHDKRGGIDVRGYARFLGAPPTNGASTDDE